MRRRLTSQSQLFQPIARIAWRDISGIIIDAHCDTLVILDCCNAGLAAVEDLSGFGTDDLWHEYRKELVGACGWGLKTQNWMSPAMSEAMRDIPNGAMSMSTIVRRMNNILAQRYLRSRSGGDDEDYEDHVPQAVHFVLRRTERDRIILEQQE
jgi:hypothetical protein